MQRPDALIALLREANEEKSIEIYTDGVKKLLEWILHVESRLADAEKALGETLRGDSFSDLLMDAANAVRENGGGPVEDCLRQKIIDVHNWESF